jgi:hypothetical protein
MDKMIKWWLAIVGVIAIFGGYSVFLVEATAPPINLVRYYIDGERTVSSKYFNNYFTVDCVIAVIDGYYELSPVGFVYRDSKRQIAVSQIRVR